MIREGREMGESGIENMRMQRGRKGIQMVNALALVWELLFNQTQHLNWAPWEIRNVPRRQRKSKINTCSPVHSKLCGHENPANDKRQLSTRP